MTIAMSGFRDDTPLPSLSEVFQFWERFGMLDNIRDHSRRVRDVSLVLTSWLVSAGVNLNVRAVEMGALLHDIAKTPCLDGSCRHDLRGAEILRELHFPELADLVAVHVYFPMDRPVDEAAIVYYADKRVRHDQVVTVEERFAYIRRRYGEGHPERLPLIAEGKRRALAMQQRIFELVPGHGPEDVNERIDRLG